MMVKLKNNKNLGKSSCLRLSYTVPSFEVYSVKKEALLIMYVLMVRHQNPRNSVTLNETKRSAPPHRDQTHCKHDLCTSSKSCFINTGEMVDPSQIAN